MHANIRFHKNDVGLLTAISTNATDTDDFLAAMADALQAEVKRAVHQTLHQPDGARYDGKAIDATIDLFGILLARALPQALEIGCRLRGYKADVIEHRVIVAGTILPEDMVDLVPNELADAVVPA